MKPIKKEISEEKLLWNYLTDGLVSLGAGVLKLPSDIGNLFDAEWANDWEEFVNKYRNSMQTDELNKERESAIQYLKDNPNDYFNALKQFPRATAYYLLEQGVPIGSAVKGLKGIKAGAELGNNLRRTMQLGNKGQIIVPVMTVGSGIKSAPLLLPTIASYKQDMDKLNK